MKWSLFGRFLGKAKDSLPPIGSSRALVSSPKSPLSEFLKIRQTVRPYEHPYAGKLMNLLRTNGEPSYPCATFIPAKLTRNTLESFERTLFPSRAEVASFSQLAASTTPATITHRKPGMRASNGTRSMLCEILTKVKKSPSPTSVS
ncbi:hypothetical protein FOTG_18903 [Fusarium oxysporum f. sp. vasinfectum 25433]|uniref:Uncharacterized protein n=1 Tax=Fusarium oxysporum f. sp. vasinfectum 25433 TaxID=1089449 RepID=X0KV95_FUSOX|nr:hypothetical protein FOTG_18903 [Fusarium oxysporum f. sp. vasinfectum 25433]